MGTEVHYREPSAPFTACDLTVGGRGILNFSGHRLAITCPACLDTEAFKRSVQYLPQVPGPPRYG